MSIFKRYAGIDPILFKKKQFQMNNFKSLLYSCFSACLIIFSINISNAQTSDFDGTDGLSLTLSGGSTMSGATSLFPAGSNWGNPTNAYVISNGSGTITTTAIMTTSLSSFIMDLQSISGTSGNGADGSDEVLVEVSTDGGSNFTTIVTVNGNNNARWTYAGGNAVSTDHSTPITIAPGGGGDRDDDMDGIESVEITAIPAGNIVIRISATNNSSNEYWTFDNLIFTESGSSCVINTVMANNGSCIGPDYTFDVSFSVTGGSGTYEVIDVTNGNAILASGSSSPITVTLTNNTSNTPFDINVWDQNDNTCIGMAVTVTPEICPQNGINCWDTNGDGINDPAEDVNMDGNFDALDCQGEDGMDGAQGPEGPTGPQGPAGNDGMDGAQGPQGPQGPAGNDGNDGMDGAQGPQGPEGPTGPQGPAGNDGSNGTDGINCWDTNGDGINDPAEDTNMDGNFDALDCQGADGMDGAQGPEGPMGPQGPAGNDGMDGAQGPQGPQGPAGNDGNDGMDGAQGPQGPEGPTGPQGPAGNDGSNGTDGINCWDTNGDGINDPAEDTNMDGNFDALDCQGVDGMDGAQGPQGPEGPTGPQGPAGNDGMDGMDGAQGPQGPEGPTGPQGPAGNDGSNGTDGINCWDTNGDGINDPAEDTNMDGNFDALDCQGEDGMDGAQGPQGPEGPTGPQGPAGNDGNDGMDGAQGPQGPEGPTGPQGPAGNDGSNGTDGINCWDTNGDGINDPAEDTNMDGNFDALDCQGADGMDGAQGPQGPEGPTGPQGPAGNDGNDGMDGAQGPAGPQGPEGPTGPQGPRDPLEIQQQLMETASTMEMEQHLL